MSYEIHITVTPREGAARPDELLGKGWKFSCFDEDEVDGIKGKWFYTTHREDRTPANVAMRVAVYALTAAGYPVERAKIEHIVFDTKRGDDVDLVQS